MFRNISLLPCIRAPKNWPQSFTPPGVYSFSLQLCSSFHKELKSVFLPLESEIFLWLVLADTMQWKWKYASSKLRPQEAMGNSALSQTFLSHHWRVSGQPPARTTEGRGKPSTWGHPASAASPRPRRWLWAREWAPLRQCNYSAKLHPHWLQNHELNKEKAVILSL